VKKKKEDKKIEVGFTNNRLTVIGESTFINNRYYYLCRCSCSNKTEFYVRKDSLLNGHTKSCGCLNKEKIAVYGKLKNKHGESYGKNRTLEYNCWQVMIQRCTNEKNPNYSRYGGRGITVCDRWLKSFENFISDMGRKPKKEYSIERVDVNGNYCPENCIWIPMSDQHKNRRNRFDLKITNNNATDIRIQYAKGEKVKELASKYNCSASNIYHILQNNTHKI